MSATYILITRFPLKDQTDIQQFKTLRNSGVKKYFIPDAIGEDVNVIVIVTVTVTEEIS